MKKILIILVGLTIANFVVAQDRTRPLPKFDLPRSLQMAVADTVIVRANITRLDSFLVQYAREYKAITKIARDERKRQVKRLKILQNLAK